ncbi:MAG TPA: hypothetical protein VGB93_12345 [Methylovirgula sp.]
MLPENKTKLASLALAGALAVGFTGAASAQDWSQTTYRETHHAMHYRYSTPQRYDYGYHREGYYRDGYDDGYRDGPVGAAGAIVGSALGAADTAAAVATGFPNGYGYYGPGPYYAPAAYYNGYSPDYGNDWWGPYHNQYQNGYPQYQNGNW